MDTSTAILIVCGLATAYISLCSMENNGWTARITFFLSLFSIECAVMEAMMGFDLVGHFIANVVCLVITTPIWIMICLNSRR